MIIFLIMEFTKEDLYLIRNRDPQIFKKIYNEYRKNIYNFLIIKTRGNEEIAEDVFCETISSALDSAPKLKNCNNILGWLICIASRRLNDYFRKYYQEKKHLDKMVGEITFNDEIIEEMHIQQKEFLLNSAMESIPVQYKQVLLLKYIEEKSQKEIAKLINNTVSSVENLLFKARKALKREISKIAGDLLNE